MDLTSQSLDGAQMSAKTRRAVACNHCRLRKIRCNGSIPCANCQDRGEECVVSARRRPRRQGSQGYDSAELSRRLHEIESLLRTSTEGSKLQQLSERTPLHQYASPSKTPSLNDHASPTTQHEDQRSNQDGPWDRSDNILEIDQHQPVSSISQQLIPLHQRSADREDTPLEENSLPENVYEHPDAEQESSSVYGTETETPIIEYFGPRCLLSLCSGPGVAWIVSKVKSPDFSTLTKGLIKDMGRMLKMSGTMSNFRAPELSPEVAWQYTKSYFEEFPEEAFGVVERPWFESRLRAHFDGTMPDDKAYYALRNIVWAFGCRITLFKTSGFREAYRASWALFENALSVHTEILFFRASMVGVQALVLMAYYSECVGKMSLQYMLCSNAMRLACSKGLHRQPAGSWNIPQREITHRNWIFWAIYCLEKQICSRSGRPSVMDDDEISCQVPENAPSGRLNDTIYCHLLIEMMRISSSTMKRLSSARALRQPPNQLIEAVHNLNSELAELKRSVQHKFCLDAQIEASQLPNGITLCQAQSLQFHYFCLVLDINTPLTYPWSGIWTYARKDANAVAQVEFSCNTVAQTARSVILATRQIHVDGGCSALIALYTPVYSFFNLFIHILRDAKLSSTRSDLLLLDIALGYFSNLEFATDLELSLPFVREMGRYVRLAVDNEKKTKYQEIDKMKPPSEDPTSSLNVPMMYSADFDSAAAIAPNDIEFYPWLTDENLEALSTLLPYSECNDILY